MKVDSRQLLAAAWCTHPPRTANGGVTGACSSDERNVELLSGWVDFYVRRMYRMGEDCWNRPVLIHRSPLLICLSALLVIDCLTQVRGAVSDRVLVLERDRDKDERMVMTDRVSAPRSVVLPDVPLCSVSRLETVLTWARTTTSGSLGRIRGAPRPPSKRYSAVCPTNWHCSVLCRCLTLVSRRAVLPVSWGRIRVRWLWILCC